ncbi:hypothetical protein PG984_006952 [Apiospora sp. TS-2023a]
MATDSKGGAPTAEQLIAASTILAMTSKESVATQARAYKVFREEVTTKNLKVTKMDTASKVLGIDRMAKDDGTRKQDTKLTELLDSCSSCRGEELIGLYPVPGIHDLQTTKKSLVVEWILRDHFNKQVPAVVAKKRKAGDSTESLAENKRAKSGTEQAKPAAESTGHGALQGGVVDRDRHVSSEYQSLVKDWRLNVSMHNLVYELSEERYTDLPDREQQVIERFLGLNARWVEERSPSMALSSNRGQLRQSVVDAVFATRVAMVAKGRKPGKVTSVKAAHGVKANPIIIISDDDDDDDDGDGSNKNADKNENVRDSASAKDDNETDNENQNVVVVKKEDDENEGLGEVGAAEEADDEYEDEGEDVDDYDDNEEGPDDELSLLERQYHDRYEFGDAYVALQADLLDQEKEDEEGVRIASGRAGRLSLMVLDHIL